VLWHSYNTHAALTFDDYFNQTILDQGTDYRYGGGFQGAARDPLQHLLPLLYTRPAAARSIILYTLRELQAPGSLVHGPPYFLIPYGVIQHGYVAPWGLRPSDLELALFLAVGEYVLATGDAGLFDEVVTTYNGRWSGAAGDLSWRRSMARAGESTSRCRRRNAGCLRERLCGARVCRGRT
jgi:cellobiose phosphorylase